MCKIRDVSELYALADKCARAEEGRKLPGENIEVGGSDSEDAAPAKKNRWRNNRKKKGKDVLVVEQSGNGGGAKEAEAVAVADKQDGTNKQYCKIHRTKGHDLQICKKVEELVEQQKAEYERRDKEKAQEGAGDPARNVPAEEDAAARPSSGNETDLPAAATRMKMTTTMKIWMMTRPVSRSSRKP